MVNVMQNESIAVMEVRALIDQWATGIRQQDFAAILSHHADDLLLFDVPPPTHTTGLDAYKRSWEMFFDWSRGPVVFDLFDIAVTAGNDVAFASAIMRWAGVEADGKRSEITGRLTMGLRKTKGQWVVVHEHHSVPATE